jgi:hypothetical protein
MKRSTIIEAFKLINGIKMNVVTDKETRASILKNHMLMYKVVKDGDEELKKVYEKLFEGKEEDLHRVVALRQEFHLSETTNERREEISKIIITDLKHILELEAELNSIFEERNEENIEINFIKMDMQEFVNACVESNIIVAPLDIAEISELFKD